MQSQSPRQVEIPARVIQIPNREVVIPAREIEVVGEDGQPKVITIPERTISIPGQEVEVPGRQVELDGQPPEMQPAMHPVETRQVNLQPIMQQPTQMQQPMPMQQPMQIQQPMQMQQPMPMQQPMQVVHQQPEAQQIAYQVPQEQQQYIAPHPELNQSQSPTRWSPERSTAKKYAPINVPEPIEYNINEVRAMTQMYNVNNGIKSVDTHGDYSYLNGRMSPGGSVHDSVHKTGALSR